LGCPVLGWRLPRPGRGGRGFFFELLPIRLVPGRHELDGSQEVQWDGVIRGIATSFRSFVAHEFVPTRDPLTSLRQAADLCDV